MPAWSLGLCVVVCRLRGKEGPGLRIALGTNTEQQEVHRRSCSSLLKFPKKNYIQLRFTDLEHRMVLVLFNGVLVRFPWKGDTIPRVMTITSTTPFPWYRRRGELGFPNTDSIPVTAQTHRSLCPFSIQNMPLLLLLLFTPCNLFHALHLLHLAVLIGLTIAPISRLATSLCVVSAHAISTRTRAASTATAKNPFPNGQC